MASNVYYSSTPLFGPNTINVATMGDQTAPRLVQTPSGLFAFYLDRSPSGDRILAREIGALSAPVGAEHVIATGLRTGSEDVDAVALANGDIAVAWASATGQVLVQVFDSALVPRDASVGVDAPQNLAINPDLSASGTNEFILAWERVLSASDHRIVVRRFQNDGVALDAAPGVELSAPVGVHARPAISANGYLVGVAWEEAGSKIWYTSRTTDGIVVATPSVIDAVGALNASPDILWGGFGFLLTYRDNQYGQEDYTLYRAETLLEPAATWRIATAPGVNAAPELSVDAYDPQIVAVDSSGAHLWTDRYVRDWLIEFVDIPLRSQSAFGRASAIWRDDGRVLLLDESTPAVTGGDGSGRSITATLFELTRVIAGDDEDDYLIAPEGPITTVLSGGGGADVLIGWSNAETMYGGPGNDQALGQDGGDLILGEDGDDWVTGGRGNDTIYGGSGDDRLVGEDDDDILVGGEGADTLVGGFLGYSGAGGSNYLDGGEGDDVIVGSDGDDLIFGGPGADLISGLEGADSIDGGPGGDVIYGGEDNHDLGDSINGGEGDDFIVADAGGDYVLAGPGDDVVDAGEGNDFVDAGDGVDTIYGGGGDDFIIGGPGAYSTIGGGDGADIIYGGAGVDYISGDDGDDTLVGLGGQDSLYGGAGNDYIVAGDGPGSVVDGGAGANMLWGAGGNDYIVGGQGNDLIVGGAGSDYQFGNAGNDTHYGGQGTDYISTNAGNDFVWTDDVGAPQSTDYIYVGGGTGTDTIADFTPGEGANHDVLVVSTASGVTSFAQAQAKMAHVGLYTVLTLGADQVYLYNLQPSQFTADNFLFL